MSTTERLPLIAPNRRDRKSYMGSVQPAQEIRRGQRRTLAVCITRMRLESRTSRSITDKVNSDATATQLLIGRSLGGRRMKLYTQHTTCKSLSSSEPQKSSTRTNWPKKKTM